jgi:hypothetical protein
MKKKPWTLKPHERERLTIAQKLGVLEDRVKELLEKNRHLNEQNYELHRIAVERRENHRRYKVLRTKELVLLEGETQYLTGEELDKYCDNERLFRFGDHTASFAHQLLASLKHTAHTTRNLINDTGSKSQETNQKDSGNYTVVLRDADGDGVRELGDTGLSGL